MAYGEYNETHTSTTNGVEESTTETWTCTTSKLSLQNIEAGNFDFSFLTDMSESGVSGCVNKILELLKSYNDNTNAYDVDGKNNFSEAYTELQGDVTALLGQLTSLQSELESKISEIEAEILKNYTWAYKASYTHKES